MLVAVGAIAFGIVLLALGAALPIVLLHEGAGLASLRAVQIRR
jgi:hypothetical protein